MIYRLFKAGITGLFVFSVLAGCITATPVPTAVTTPASIPTSFPAPTSQPLTVNILYPKPDTVVEMGQSIKAIVDVSTPDGQRIPTAELTLTATPPEGGDSLVIPISAGKDGVFRSEAVIIPHRSVPGPWKIEVKAQTPNSQGEGSSAFDVMQSTSEILLEKYGFWLDAPTMRGIVPTLVAEAGDAQNGMIRWGGSLAAQHILPTSFVELNWRTGKFPLENPDDVRRFLLEQIGNLGFTEVRAIGEITREPYKNWDGWKVQMRGKRFVDKLEYMVFYAPEVDKTFSFGTTVVQPLSGMDPHFVLRQSFELHPEVNAQGVAPEPLQHLLPGVTLLSPEMGQRYLGTSQPVILKWQPVSDLEEGDIYQVSIDYDYNETTNTVLLFTEDTQITVPAELFSKPNCIVFNWSVVLKHQTGIDAINRPAGPTLTYPSMYWYFMWLYPPGADMPFHYFCPNPQT